MIMNLKRMLLGKDHPFRPLEKSLLRTLCGALPYKSAQKLEKQLSRVCLIQRHRDHSEICLYTSKPQHSAAGPEEAFLDKRDEVRFATVHFAHPHHLHRKVRAHFWMVNGRIFSIDFDQPTKTISRVVDLSQVEVRLHSDPDVSLPPKTSVQHARIEPVLSYIRSHCPNWAMSIEVEGRGDSSPASRLVPWKTVFPNDYLDLMAMVDGFICERARVLSASAIRPVFVSGRPFLIVAELAEACFLVVEEGACEPRVYLLNHDSDDVLVDLGESLLQALIHLRDPNK